MDFSWGNSGEERFPGEKMANIFADHPLVPLVLLVFALQTSITTATCIMDMISWEGYSGAEQRALGGLYVPYLIFGES